MARHGQAWPTRRPRPAAQSPQRVSRMAKHGRTCCSGRYASAGTRWTGPGAAPGQGQRRGGTRSEGPRVPGRARGGPAGTGSPAGGYLRPPQAVPDRPTRQAPALPPQGCRRVPRRPAGGRRGWIPGYPGSASRTAPARRPGRQPSAPAQQGSSGGSPASGQRLPSRDSPRAGRQAAGQGPEGLQQAPAAAIEGGGAAGGPGPRAVRRSQPPARPPDRPAPRRQQARQGPQRWGRERTGANPARSGHGPRPGPASGPPLLRAPSG